jgi:hypothetical protein
MSASYCNVQTKLPAPPSYLQFFIPGKAAPKGGCAAGRATVSRITVTELPRRITPRPGRKMGKDHVVHFAGPLHCKAAKSQQPRGKRLCCEAASSNGFDSSDSLDTISTDELTDWKGRGPPTPLLDTVNFPVHIKNFNTRQLQQLCKELRAGAWARMYTWHYETARYGIRLLIGRYQLVQLPLTLIPTSAAGVLYCDCRTGPCCV